MDDPERILALGRGIYVAQYQYNPGDRMTTVVLPNLTVSTYTYGADGLGRKIQEPGAGVVTVVFDGAEYLKEKS